MQPDKIEEINGWLAMADESYNNAIECFENNQLKVVQNRLYYSIFYAAKALAINENFITSKHKSLYSWFNKNYIKTKIFTPEMGILYNESFEKRSESDYTINFIPDKESLKQDLEKAKAFIETIKQHLERI